MSFNISPEEILKQKELMGGIQYDDPANDPMSVKQSGINQTTQEVDIPKSPPVNPAQTAQISEKSNTNIRTEKENGIKPNSSISSSLGKAQSHGVPLDTGWKNLPVSILPSRGLFYPDGTKIAIRPAEVREIRHFSTIDEDDRLDIEDKLSYVLERCSRMEFPGEGVVSYKDLKQEDRFFIIMAIRDLTFIKGENSIFLKPYKNCNQTPECPFPMGIELRTGALSSYEIDPKIFSYYNAETRSFVFELKRLGKKLELNVPSIGVTQAISSFVINQTKKGNPPDDGFLKIAPFIFSEWRDLNETSLLSKMREMDYWTKEEYSLAFELSDKIKIGTELEVKQQCPVCGGMEVAAEISFPSGLRSLFVISDIFRELL